MTRKQRRGVLIGVGVGVLTAGGGPRAVRPARLDRLLPYAERRRREADRGRPALPPRRAGRGRLGEARRGHASVEFTVTDTLKTVPVTYEGVLPDLFREGQGVVAEGKLTPDGTFVADTVLAKHDENYMPPEVAKALKEKGVKLGDRAHHGLRRQPHE